MKGEVNMEQNDAEIKKALEYCVIGDCFRCPLYYVHNCRTQLREGTNNILNKQQLELVLKRNTINDLNNKLTEKQLENEKLQSLCTSKDVIIKEQQVEIEKFKNAIKEADQLFSEGFLYDGLAIVLRLAIETERGGENA